MLLSSKTWEDESDINFSLLVLFIEALSQGQALKDIVIIHHTNCGCTNITDDAVKAFIKAQAPRHAAEIDQFVFGTYDGSSLEKHEKSVRDVVNVFKSSPLIRQELRDHANGYGYDIKTGKLVQIM